MSNSNLPNITQKGKVYFDIRDKKIFLDVEDGEALNTNNRIEFKEVDQSLIENSINAVAGGAVYTELANKFNTNDVSNDISTDASSTTKVPSVKAIKDYADSLNNNTNLSLTTSGSGNVITDLSLNNNVITITKGTAATTDNNTHYTTHLYSTGSTANTQNVAVSSGDVYLRLYDDTNASSVLQLHAGSNMSITSDANGVITFAAVNSQALNVIGSSSISSFLTSDDAIPSVKAMVTYIDSLITAGNGGSY